MAILVAVRKRERVLERLAGVELGGKLPMASAARCFFWGCERGIGKFSPPFLFFFFLLFFVGKTQWSVDAGFSVSNEKCGRLGEGMSR